MSTTTAPPMLQNHVEFQQLLDLYVWRGPERVLEVGVGEGGTLYRWLLYATAGARVVALDDRHQNRDAYPSWTPDSVELVTITGSSHDPDVLLDVAGYRPFDFIFIDADKASSDIYFKAILPMSHPGTVVIVDNVVRDGKVADAKSEDEDIQGIRRMTEWLGTQPTISATAIQTVGWKSYDGFLMAIIGT